MNTASDLRQRLQWLRQRDTTKSGFSFLVSSYRKAHPQVVPAGFSLRCESAQSVKSVAKSFAYHSTPTAATFGVVATASAKSSFRSNSLCSRSTFTIAWNRTVATDRYQTWRI